MEERISALYARFREEPFAKTLGAVLVNCTWGSAELCVDAVPEHVGIVGGVAQGGYTTSLADYAAVYAAMSVIPEGHTPCKRITVDLLRPVMVGEALTVFGEVVNESATEILVQATVHAPGMDDRPKALVTLVFAKPKGGA